MFFSLGSLLVDRDHHPDDLRHGHPPAGRSAAGAGLGGEGRRAVRIAANLRSVWVIIRDYEQEIAFILALWSITLIVEQARQVSRNRKLLDKVYVDVDENHVVLPEDARAYARPLERLSFEEQDMFLPRALMVGLNRFGSTRRACRTRRRR